jgi:hypothetical protein
LKPLIFPGTTETEVRVHVQQSFYFFSFFLFLSRVCSTKLTQTKFKESTEQGNSVENRVFFIHGSKLMQLCIQPKTNTRWSCSWGSSALLAVYSFFKSSLAKLPAFCNKYDKFHGHDILNINKQTHTCIHDSTWAEWAEEREEVGSPDYMIPLK